MTGVNNGYKGVNKTKIGKANRAEHTWTAGERSVGWSQGLKVSLQINLSDMGTLGTQEARQSTVTRCLEWIRDQINIR